MNWKLTIVNCIVQKPNKAKLDCPYYYLPQTSSLLPFASRLLSFLQNEPKHNVAEASLLRVTPIPPRRDSTPYILRNKPNFPHRAYVGNRHPVRPRGINVVVDHRGYVGNRYPVRPRGTKPDRVRRNEANFLGFWHENKGVYEKRTQT